MRRRQAALGAAAVLAFAVGVAAGGGNGETPRKAAPKPGVAPAAADRAAARELPLTRQVGRLVVLRFAGISTPAYVRRVLRQGRAAGSILFRDNLTGAAQLAAGTVRADAEAAGKALRATGITVTLAPVGDVASVPGAALAGRTFSSSFGATAAAMADSVRGWRAGGVAPTAKHFPGLGGATVNTDDGSATIDRTAQQLRDEDLQPFRAAIHAGVPLVMAGHATYPAIDPDRIASQSPKVIDGLLRGELGFKGVVITDSTEAAAVQAVTGVQEAAVRNVRAGVDIVLTTGRGSYIQVYRALLAEARRDPAFRERVRESAARVVALQRSLR